MGDKEPTTEAAVEGVKVKKKDIPLDREDFLVELISGIIIQLLIESLAVLDDLIHGKGFRSLFMSGKTLVYLYKYGVRDFGELIKAFCIFIPLFVGLFFALRGLYYRFKRMVILKFGKRYDAYIIDVQRMNKKFDVSILLTVEYRDNTGRFHKYHNPGLNPFTDYRIVSKACSIYVLGRSKYVTDFVLAPKDLVEEFKKLTEELGSEELAMEELKRRYGDTGDNSRIGGY